MKVLVTALVAIALPLLAEDTKLGAGVTLKDATPIASLTATPQQFVGKTVRVDGVATAVCEEMGCWMAIAPADAPAGPAVRLKVDHGAGIVFPMTAKGKQVSAEGVFESLAATDAEGKEAAGEHAAKDPTATAQYQIKATGAVIK